MEQNHQLGKVKGSLLPNPESYRRLVDRLIYLTFTHLDLAYSVQFLSQFMHQSRQDHWDVLFEFSNILKVLQVKAYFSVQTRIYNSVRFVIQIGSTTPLLVGP